MFRTLRGSCNIQIALNGVSIAFMEVSAFVPLYLTASGQNFLTLMPCGLIQAIPWFCTIYTNGNGLSIGVDRLLSVLFPFWYPNLLVVDRNMIVENASGTCKTTRNGWLSLASSSTASTPQSFWCSALSLQLPVRRSNIFPLYKSS